MLILVTRYVFLLSIMLDTSNAYVYQTENIDDSLIETAICTSACLKNQQEEHEHHQEEQQQQQQEKYQQAHYEQQQQTNKLPGHMPLLQYCYEDCRQNNNNKSNNNNYYNNNMEYNLTANTGSKSAHNRFQTHQIVENFTLKLMCRDENSLSFRIEMLEQQNRSDQALNVTKAVQDLSQNVLYVIRIHIAKDPEASLVYLSDESFFTLDNLSPNTTHNLTVIAVHANNEYSVIAKGQQFNTLHRGYMPRNVTGIQVLSFHIDNSSSNILDDGAVGTEQRLKAKITWKPATDLTCHYNIICFSPSGKDTDLIPMEIRDPRQLYTYELPNLAFGSTYRIGIHARNPNSLAKESDLFWETFETPSCAQWYNNNYSICAPNVPSDLRVEQMYVAEHEYSLNITWQKPEHLPDNYTLRIVDLESGHIYIRNLSKHADCVFLPKVKLNGVVFEVQLSACTPGGCTSAITTVITKTMVFVTEKNPIPKLISLILAPVFCIGVLFFTTFMIFHRRAKLKRYQERCKYFEELEKEAPIETKTTFDFPTLKAAHMPLIADNLTQFQLDLEEKILFDDAMEIDRDDITLYETLGEGAFGLVRRGVYACRNEQGECTTREVAVKMLKDHPSVDEVRAFRREIEVMKSVERHPHIVGIIGHCTRRLSDMMLLTEYCSVGNLLEFLRDEWKYLHDLHMKKSQRQQSLRKHTKAATQEQEQQQSDEQLNSADSVHKIQQQENADSNEQRFDYADDATYTTSSPLTGRSTATTSCKSSILNQSLATNERSDAKDTTMRIPATDNKCYGYEEICSSACKCQVYVIQAQLEPGDNDNKTDMAMKPTIEIKDCTCQLQRRKYNKNINNNEQEFPATQLQSTSLSVENKEYFKEHMQSMDQNILRNTSRLQCDAVLTHEKKQRVALSAWDLLDIARQVAVGMEFLAKNKVVHRDLAARNVLVSPDRTVKIADFGLSRDVYQENIYKKTGNGKLPIKWLALESLTHQVYTTHSDVWSYGILLYEIVTLGGTPYPSIPTNRLLYLLKSGFRMEKPKYCGQELYDLMSSCWHANPSERPTFAQIIKTLEQLLKEEPQKQIECTMGIISQRLPNKIPKPIIENSDDPYLKPL